MKSHRYRITVEHLEDAEGQPVQAAPLIFETRNHDALFSIVARLREKSLFEGDEGVSFAIGLKLFSEVMLKHKSHPLFEPLQPHFGTFMKGLKKPSESQA